MKKEIIGGIIVSVVGGIAMIYLNPLLTENTYLSEVKHRTIAEKCKSNLSPKEQKNCAIGILKEFDSVDNSLETIKELGEDTTQIEKIVASGTLHEAKQAVEKSIDKYDRRLFAHWSDADNDCLNTRGEILSSTSLVPASFSPNGCQVVKGKWQSPYSKKTFSDPRDVDIDHIVPLAEAWQAGAQNWSDKKRSEFANDPINLLAVGSVLNQKKGTKGPAEWLPPNETFLCTYITKWSIVKLKYDLSSDKAEQGAVSEIYNKYCEN